MERMRRKSAVKKGKAKRARERQATEAFAKLSSLIDACIPLGPPMYQTVELTLGDGRVVVFTGQAVVYSDEPKLTLTRIKFTPPQPLPPGCSFGPIKP